MRLERKSWTQAINPYQSFEESVELEMEVTTENTFALLHCGHLGKILKTRLKPHGIPQVHTPLKRLKCRAQTPFSRDGIPKKCAYLRVITRWLLLKQVTRKHEIQPPSHKADTSTLETSEEN